MVTVVEVNLDTADDIGGPAAVKLTCLATVAAVAPSIADGGRDCDAVELTILATVATAVGPLLVGSVWRFLERRRFD